MRLSLLSACLFFSFLNVAAADENKITKSASGWELANNHIRMQLSRTSETVNLQSLMIVGGKEWAAPGTPILALPNKADNSYQYADDEISDVAKGGKQLTLHFQSRNGCIVSLEFILYPTGAVIQTSMRIENHSQRALPLENHLDPLFLHLKGTAAGLKTYSSTKQQHGFQITNSASGNQEFSDWMVLEDPRNNESMLVGGEPGLGVLGWNARVSQLSNNVSVRAGTILIKAGKGNVAPVLELRPGEVVETPISFFALANGDTDTVGNETFRYLKKYVFLTPLPDSPLVAYCIWLTQKDSEEPLLAEMKFAKRVGFDVFYHDATWYQGSSNVPGMNDWTRGLGSYLENKEKFPNGIKRFSDSVHAAGMKFGLWVDPGNVDASRVASGEIPEDWLAKVDGKTIGTTHPSLTPTKQLCLGNPHVVRWIEKQLGDIIEQWSLDWIKWDPSSTVTYECTRTDHGHGKTDGAYAAYRGRLEIMRYLLKRFPHLSGFECDPSLEFSRTNSGPQSLLPGGYTNEFITGPMVSPNVWGSLASVREGRRKTRSPRCSLVQRIRFGLLLSQAFYPWCDVWQHQWHVIPISSVRPTRICRSARA